MIRSAALCRATILLAGFATGPWVPAHPLSPTPVRIDHQASVIPIQAPDQTPRITSLASTASSITRAGSVRYAAAYSPHDWSGSVSAHALAQTTARAGPQADWSAQTTADKLDALADIDHRLVLTRHGTSGAGVPFDWAHLTDAQKKTLQWTGDSDQTGAQRVQFLRGDRSLEGGVPHRPFRIRSSRQGDTVHSALWYVGAPVGRHASVGYRMFVRLHAARLPMLYVGGNDGMLHGFSAADGTEKIAYVPQGVLGSMKELSHPRYQHRYYVDGSPFSGDVPGDTADPADWRTLLVGSLGAGGKGYFVLDITRPERFTARNAARLVVLDRTAPVGDATAGAAADIGQIHAPPVTDDNNPQQSAQIVRLNNGRWAVVMGNGYRSRHARPVLLIQYLDGAQELQTLVAAQTSDQAGGNGLSAPRLVDIDGDGMPDVVYAGDLQGHLWKFDITSVNAIDWHVAFDGQPLFTANGARRAQPISVAPAVKAHDRGTAGMMVAFGTGRPLWMGDCSDNTSGHTLYAVLDDTHYTVTDGKVMVDPSAPVPVPVAAGELVEQTVSAAAIPGQGRSAARRFWRVSQNPVNYRDARQAARGWFMHLPAQGEQLLHPLSFWQGSNILEVLTEAAAPEAGAGTDSCSPAAHPPRRWRTLLNIQDGRKPRAQLIDSNGDGVYDAEDGGVSRMTASPQESRHSNRTHELRAGSDGITDHLAKMPEQPLHPNWRQLR